MQSFTFLLALTSIVPFTHGAAIEKRTVPVKSGWTLTFSDDFTGTAGTLPSSSKWIIDTGTQYPGGEPRWGNNEVQTYTKDKANIEITADQTLKMTPRKSASGAWTSSRIESVRTDFFPPTGHQLFVEARIKVGTTAMSQQQGIWLAFWALGAPFRGNYHNWPAVSEWDILELINGQNKLYSTAHCGVASGGPCNEPVGLGSGGANTMTRGAWQTYGFRIDRSMTGPGQTGTWRDEVITWYLNGNAIYSLKGSTVNDAPAWKALAQTGHFLLFNAAVGGNWAGAPNAQTVGGPGVGMEIDYVGVWNK